MFGWLPQKRPPGGPRKRWRDVVKTDLKMVGVLDTWYSSALHGNMWNRLYTNAIQRNRQLARSSLSSLQCVACGRTFRRDQDRARHKCIEEQSNPVHQQQGALQCSTCRKWFRSMRGLAVHSCQLSTEAVSVDNEVHDSVSKVDNRVYCAVCERNFSQIGDLKRHKCLAERSLPVEEQQGATQCLVCHRWFRSKGGFAVHECSAVEGTS